MTSDTRTRPASALGLHPLAYTDPAWLAREQELLFERSWTLVASVDELANAGATLSAMVGRKSMVVVRAGAELQAFVDRGPDAPELTAGSVAVWEGMVFVHPDASPPLSEVLGAFPDYIGSFEPGRLTEVARLPLEGNFNWKLFVENHIDIYHLWYLHETSLGAFDHTKFEHWRVGTSWASYEPFKADTSRAVKLDAGTAAIRHLDDRDRDGIGAHMVFPNILMASTSEFFATYAVYPLSPSRSRVDLRIRAEPDAGGDELLQAIRSFINEDIVACEGVQDALGSSRFHVGAFARDHEQSISEFHHDLIAVLGEPQ